jgi:SlyX protein
MDLEHRMIELETKISYQDHMIQELNDVIVSQQRQIDALQQQLVRVRDHLKSTHSSGLARPDEEAPPPHY